MVTQAYGAGGRVHSKAVAHQAPCPAEEPRMLAAKYTPGQSPRAVLPAQAHTVSKGLSSTPVPPGGMVEWGGSEGRGGLLAPPPLLETAHLPAVRLSSPW